MKKVAEVNALFWITKIFATTLGETGGDLLSMTLKIGYGASSLILVGLFLTLLTVQLKSRKYHPVLFWSVITLTLIAGTTMSDYIDRTLGLGYALGSIILITILFAILAVWRVSERSLSVENIRSGKVELLYWMAILFSNTLGTALGDFLADNSGLGFMGGAFLIGGLLIIVLMTYYWTNISRVFLFWAAFILTRPFGATFGDVLTKTQEKGGLDLGTLGSSAFFVSMLIILVSFAAMKERQASRQLQETVAEN